MNISPKSLSFDKRSFGLRTSWTRGNGIDALLLDDAISADA